MEQEKIKIESVKKMQEYIAKNLEKNITMSDLAKIAGYSQSHSARVFAELTGKRPFEYIRMLRLTTAARVLRDNNTKVLDVALDFVFDSHEGFTRAFTRQFGVSPYRYKTCPIPIKYFVPYTVHGKDLKKEKGYEDMKKEFIFTQVIDRPKRRAIIKRGKNAKDYYEYCNEVSCDIWGVLESVKEALYEPAGFWLPNKLIKAGTSPYVQGVEVDKDYNGVVPDGFDMIELEPCQVMIFQGEPYEDEYFEDAITGVWESIEKFNPKIYGYDWAENDAPRFQLTPIGERGYIEGRPIKKL